MSKKTTFSGDIRFPSNFDVQYTKPLDSRLVVDNVEDLFVGVFGKKPTANALIDYLKIKRPVDLQINLAKRRNSKIS